jgi:hypothetical protein
VLLACAAQGLGSRQAEDEPSCSSWHWCHWLWGPPALDPGANIAGAAHSTRRRLRAETSSLT